MDNEFSIHGFVTDQLEHGITAHHSGSALTRRLLRRCIPRAAAECEGLCPAVLGATSGGLRVHYGPMVPAGYGRLVVFATPRHSISLAFDWPDVPEASSAGLSSAALWGVMHDAIREGRGSYAIVLLAGRLGAAGRAAFDAKAEELIRRKLTPVIIAMAVQRKGQACGATVVLPLPRTIEAQMEVMH